MNKVLFFLSVTSFVFGIDISSKLAEHNYRQLDCKESVTESGVKYECEKLNEEEKCFHQGQWYEDGYRLKESEVESCDKGCFCDKGDWRCAAISCPQGFQRMVCHNLVDCCPETCKEDPETLPKCNVDGQQYKVGQMFYPKINDYKCTKCICTKEFNGTLSEPFCRKLNCNLYLHYSDRFKLGCEPAYHDSDGCCPIPMFRCPTDDDKAEGEIPVIKSTSEQCHFGKITLEVGQELSRNLDEKCVICKCVIPPKVSCILDHDCYYRVTEWNYEKL